MLVKEGIEVNSMECFKRRVREISQLECYFVSDEVYHGLNYEGRDHSILEFTDKAFVINSFSKKYAMTGWRLGYVIVPPKYIRYMQVIQQNLFISTNSFIPSLTQTL